MEGLSLGYFQRREFLFNYSCVDISLWKRGLANKRASVLVFKFTTRPLV